VAATYPTVEGLVEAVEQGRRLGAQSVRNPRGLSAPDPRPSRNGFLWCYEVESGKAGWVPVDALSRVEVALARRGETHCGPANLDAQVGFSEPLPKKATSVGGEARRGRLIVKSRDAYLRYSPRGTAHEYVLKGDVLEARWIRKNAPGTYLCVRVVESDSAPVGTIGWIGAPEVKSG
jgi:hypothetical protein